jgi:hypothetical protein
MANFKRVEKTLSLILLFSFLISIFIAPAVYQSAFAGNAGPIIGQESDDGMGGDVSLDSRCKWYQV